MREIGRSGAVRCTASPVPFARAAGARQHRPGAATAARAFLARRAAAGAAGPGSAGSRVGVAAARSAGVREGGPSVREGGSGVREGGPGIRQGGPGIRQGGPGIREGGPGVREGGPGIRLGGPGVRSAARRVPPPARRPDRGPSRAPRPDREPWPGRVPAPRRAGAVEAGAGRAGRRPVRLTRRGRVVLLCLVLLLGALVGFVVASPGRAADPPKPAVTAVVQPGDTLWSFAERNLPRWHTIDAVTELQRLNHLEGSVIHPGQRLALPSRR